MHRRQWILAATGLGLVLQLVVVATVTVPGRRPAPGQVPLDAGAPVRSLPQASETAADPGSAEAVRIRRLPRPTELKSAAWQAVVSYRFQGQPYTEYVDTYVMSSSRLFAHFG